MPGIDLHTHLAPDGVPPRPGPPALSEPDLLVRRLNEGDLDAAAVSVPPTYYRQDLAPRAAADWVAAVNDGLRKRIRDHPSLRRLAYLPLEHPELALAEYRRVSADPTLTGVVAAAGGRSAALDGPRLVPLWRVLDRDSRMVFLHPGNSRDDRLGRFYLDNLLGNPTETAVAAAQLVFGGVLARHQRVKVVLAHCGGAVGAMAGRWQRGTDTARPGVPVSVEPPRRALRRFYVDSLAHDPTMLDLAVAIFGVDRIVLGSDWPYPMGQHEEPLAAARHRGSHFLTAVALHNPARALGVHTGALTGERSNA